MPNNVYPQHFQHHKQLMVLCSCSERVSSDFLETAAYGIDSVNVSEKLNMTASATYPHAILEILVQFRTNCLSSKTMCSALMFPILVVITMF